MFADELREQAKGIADLSPEQVSALEAHYRLMVLWNRTVNLTKIIEESEAVKRHYVESLFLGAHLPAGRLKVADVGSGPGFPGIPVAVLRPDCEVTLIESHQRKSVFLREASRGLRNVRVLAKRAEEVDGPFDWLISRAVSAADLSKVQELASRIALLSGSEEPIGLDYSWEAPVEVPGSKSLFLRMGFR